MTVNSLNEYFARAPTAEIAEKCWAIVESDRAMAAPQTRLYSLLAKAALYYFGKDLSGSATQGITRGGDQGELAMIRVNHARSLVQTQLNLILASKIVWQPIATNSDYKSAAQTILASSVLEYYWRDKQVSKYYQRDLEEAIVFGECFFYRPWDMTKGPPTPLPELDETGGIKLDAQGSPVMKQSGDFAFKTLSAPDVIRDPYKRSFDELDWVIVHTRENKFNLAAQTADPKVQAQILNLPVDIIQHGADYQPAKVDVPTNDVDVFKLYHKKTPILPEGRETVFLSQDIVLEDGPLTYEDIPLDRCYSAELFGSPYAYSSFFEILGIQELVDSLHTCVATNQTTFGTQMIGAPDGTTVSPDSFGGMKLLKYPAGSGEPKAIQLTKSPPEVFNYIETLVSNMEQLMGLNSVARGEPQSGEQSGAALALLEAKAKQQMSVLEGSFLRSIQSSGSGIIDTIRRKCPYPRRVAISGVSNKALERSEEYGKDSFEQIHRVQVDIGNPLSQTAAGRQELANMYLQLLGPKMTGEQMEQVLTTGRLEPMTQSLQRELLLIKSENELIARGAPGAIAMADDDHVLHMREHRCEMANPEVRNNPAAIEQYTQHQNEHWELYNTVDPARLMVFGMQPPPQLGPPMPPPPGTPGPVPGPAEPPSVAPNAPELPNLPSLPEGASPELQPSPGVAKPNTP